MKQRTKVVEEKKVSTERKRKPVKTLEKKVKKKRKDETSDEDINLTKEERNAKALKGNDNNSYFQN